MAKIAVKKALKKEVAGGRTEDVLTTVATFCFYYPQYTYSEALDLPVRTIKRLLRVARREQALKYINLAQIARVSQAEKNEPFSKLVSRYEEMING